MDELQLISELFEDLQNDESVDLGAYAERFVEVSEAKDGLIAVLTENGEASKASEETIAELKNANWELSKKITKPQAEVEEVKEVEEEDETPYETNDEALAELFDKDEKDEDKEKEK